MVMKRWRNFLHFLFVHRYTGKEWFSPSWKVTIKTDLKNQTTLEKRDGNLKVNFAYHLKVKDFILADFRFSSHNTVLRTGYNSRKISGLLPEFH